MVSVRARYGERSKRRVAGHSHRPGHPDGCFLDLAALPMKQGNGLISIYCTTSGEAPPHPGRVGVERHAPPCLHPNIPL